MEDNKLLLSPAMLSHFFLSILCQSMAHWSVLSLTVLRHHNERGLLHGRKNFVYFSRAAASKR